MLRTLDEITVCKRFRFDAAHYLPYHEGACQHLHGHSYVLEVEIGEDKGEVDKTPAEQGMIIDFGRLKDIVNENIIDKFDHNLLNNYFDNPTAEKLVWTFTWILQDALPDYVKLKSVRLYETENSWAQWSAQ